MTSLDKPTPGILHYATPCFLSETISSRAGFKVYLKLENLQPSGSFKIRGIGNFCQKAKQRGATKFSCSSGGNAGLAAALAARKLGLPLFIVVPETCPSFIQEDLRKQGAQVEVFGSCFDEANERALTKAEKEGLVHIHPFDHPDIWEGHSSMIMECEQQLESKPDVVVTCVGGGGLLNGILDGLKNVGWDDLPVIAMETIGADCFNKAVEKGSLVTLPAITSIAKCLGALTVSKRTFECTKMFNILSEVVEDKEAVRACLNFADDEKMIVEPSCGATLAAVYSGVIQKLLQEKKLRDIRSALVIVCGGKMVNLELLQNWKLQFGL
ncbi:serine dehydratase-like [Octopus bimaculoides]|uniref:L-serine ammonia-lyase n=1 Tax=Octopus bimaculoides TaxID=37653 RepID=A0A0L8IG81_OCTBM|nr:serine dehydratase-like [Octopus bimaculoides]XP_014767607.1 serine dehydratase-like [Octopus bimaculoides]XP_052826649.1 serine dehydratase-like [Octopus bimaculoides]|eukprot:XP_014767599.1 PREDICTED: serine dehydratase-like [Octopus bimaculoides]